MCSGELMNDALAVRHVEEVMRSVGGALRGGSPACVEHIASSWTRCAKEFQLDPCRNPDPTVLDAAALAERRERNEELISVATAEMELLCDQIAGSGYALLLTDASGVILCEKVDPTLQHMFGEAGLIVGADWSERREGTNGIGTCIAERRSVTVHRDEHFNSRHIGLSCSGALIRDPADEVIGVLDASCVSSHDTRASQRHTMALVNMSAHIIEKCLFLRRFQHCQVLHFHYRPEFVNLLHDGALALAPDGTIIAADRTATSLLAASGRYDLPGRQLQEVFDAGLEDFLSCRASRRPITPVRDVHRGRRYFVSLHDAACGLLPRANEPKSCGRDVVRVTPSPGATLTLEELAGEDPQFLRSARQARRIADSGVPVLLQGPTGSGKEVFARALHMASCRADKPFVPVNCAAIPDTLIEAELFGYKPGAFTGARKEGMKGRILQSSGGTLFLDEIGDMPLALQTRLLRVLQEQEVVPLGSETPIRVDLHVIAATHCNLREMIAQKTFREDLYFRLNGITLELPALARRSDRERVIQRVLAAETANGRPAAIETDALHLLCAYSWPGNIRELRNVIRTAIAICDGGVIRAGDLPREVRQARCDEQGALVWSTPVAQAPSPAEATSSSAQSADTMKQTVGETERALLMRTIDQNRWNMTYAARQLGMSRNTLYRKVKRYGIPLPHGARHSR
jgi:sigma-54 dependent transcriptional regulator, acetoin dehydrogenase operon transcriptional activator AcoR